MISQINFSIPAEREYVGLARLVVGGLISGENSSFGGEVVEDIKLALSEVCTHIVRAAAGQPRQVFIELSFLVNEEELILEVGADDPAVDLAALTPDLWVDPGGVNYGLAIITSLLDHVELVSDPRGRAVLRLKKFSELPI